MQRSMDSNSNNGDAASTASKKSNRCRSFHFRYLELCRAKNMTPLTEVIRSKNNATTTLDFFGDKISVSDWLLITESLFYDQVLQTLAIRLRRCLSSVVDHTDTEKKAKVFKQKPAIFTKFVFSGVVEAMSNCIQYNKSLKVLHLEGLPLSGKYCEMIAKALSFNDSLKDISFQRSTIMDGGCEVICNTLKYLDNVEKLNMSDCMLTTKGAEFIAEMIKMQKISRFTEGWQKSLRYREFDPDDIPGLKSIALARNPQVGDDGVKAIVEVLKEDFGVKIVDMENCGLTDRAANIIMDCLEINQYIMDFNVRNNPGISKLLLRSVREQLGKDADDQRTAEEMMQQAVRVSNADKKSKPTVPQLTEQLKSLQEQLDLERNLRKKAEQLNEKLTQQIMACESQLEKAVNADAPEGYVFVKQEALQSIISERNDFEKIATQVFKEMHQPSPCENILKSKMLNLKLQPKIYEEEDEDDELTDVVAAEPSLRCSPQVSSRSSASVGGPGSSRSIQTDDLRQIPTKTGIRQVKSEMKYVEEANISRKRESKSDHEFASEVEAPRFETDIGDMASHVPSRPITYSIEQQQQQRIHLKMMSTRSDKRKNTNPIPNGDYDQVSLSTSRSGVSDSGSHASRTLRNTDLDAVTESDGGDQHQYGNLKKKTVISKTAGSVNLITEYGQGEGVNVGGGKKTARSIFMGLC